ncbi:hypothetical protein [Actinocorallia sp. A-T 12471]|uniref:hypothetical protein n=1 Tax=Actinocorallia sp. A-T 12471 TaxID=3089813 RepID=UPI0029D0680E|nr:hypothetical protein [Actinocorallia sp. A-T 12471]MDX6742101.1 hypothetical protein [Actinocorallia sp. A-T 12471]
MSIRLSVRRIPKEVGRSQRIMDYGTSAMSHARTGATHAAGWMSPMYGNTRRYAADRMIATRGWTAPQIDRSADFFDSEIAPRISSMLHGTASWVKPPRRRRGWSMLAGGAALAALGCAAAGMVAARRRNRLADLLEPEIGISERQYTEEHASSSGTYQPATGYSSSSSSYGGGVGRGGGTGHSRGIGHD